ncbi:MarR family winged helix-turn-helix transcriptional regulator [Meiothermus ruber]|jgi:DNA-binding MarR family transcriptional regulator|uniref:MarR family transcriptional regulator n=1 Tax=Meiothermus ruber (strain ATCC 35948 / DSM 1279 / VKM B-1258 / 21) TaxID=504728 RepID=D3PL27_MEIRD|nr:MarR family transcriptional regulator [Meiothermus ruber]ADD26923.1 transcriptional regulator, MarR family [Meiothermus ruber DSM 1279]AGK03377.1 MarR family transcriptional regulator [Meiothermus ruber DSM 1279]MCL6531146.1 MarR family transcriptional regulator [Meiothermus ruber]MCX7802697.1 MarR family transcriptional regulator [Meiothermus ruber]GAO73839.1 MarR family transcriptional regulato [Meiothermus ruber H328]
MAWGLLTNLWRLSRGLREEVVPHLEHLGLAPTDPWLLAEIERHHYPTEAVRAMQMPAPTISQMLKRLEQAGLVVRSLDPADLRRYRFELTEAGRAVLEESRQHILKALERRLERLNPQQRRQFAEWLEILAREEAPVSKE